MRSFPCSYDKAAEELSHSLNVVRNASTFVSLGMSESNRSERRRALAHWLIANGFWKPLPRQDKRGPWGVSFVSDSLFPEADKIIEKIQHGEVDPFESANRMIDFLKEQNKSTSTIIGMRSNLLLFLRYSRLGLDPSDLTLAVKKPHRVPVLASRLPTRDQVRGLLIVSPLKVKLFISMLISTGARIGEVRHTRVTDIDFSKKPVYLHIRETKTGIHRIGFLSSETVLFLKSYLKSRRQTPEHIFNGYAHKRGCPTESLDRPLSHTVAWQNVNRAFRKLQMDERYGGFHHYYHPHVFRTLSLAILKTGGYPADWAEHLVGHSIGTHAAYLPPVEVLASEWLKHDGRFCFLTDSPTMPRLEEPVSEPQRSEVFTVSKHEQIPSMQKTAIPAETHRWASKGWYYVKTRIDSADYDSALADGYAILDKGENGLRVLRKRTGGWFVPLRTVS